MRGGGCPTPNGKCLKFVPFFYSFSFAREGKMTKKNTDIEVKDKKKIHHRRISRWEADRCQSSWSTRQQSRELLVFLHWFAATFSFHLLQLSFLIVSLLFHLNLSLVFWFSASSSFPRICLLFLSRWVFIH